MHEQLLKRHGAWVALWAALIVAALYSRPPIPIDETRYLSVAWEMWQNGNFLVPHINGMPYSHKPPLLFWLIHLVWAVFGVSELSARLVAPCFGLLSIVLTIRLASKLWPQIPQIRATVPYIMLGTLVWSVFSSLTMFDTLLTSFVLLCLYSVYKASQEQFSLAHWIVAGLFLGLGILAKGPVVCVYVLPVIIFAPLWLNQKSFTWSQWYLGGLLSLIIGIGIALCWALPAASAGGEEYANAILLHQTAGRVVHSFAHNRPFYWYLIVLPLLFFPWFFWLPSWQSGKQQWREPGTRFCITAAVGSLLVLSSVSGKQIHYFLPVMPVVSLLFARNLVNLNETKAIDRTPIFAILILLAAALVLLPLLPLDGGDREILSKIPGWLPVVPIACAMPLLLARKSPAGTIRFISLCTAALFVLLHLSLQAPLHQTYSQRDIGEFLARAQAEKRPIAVLPDNLIDQFQFAGKLSQIVYPAKSRSDLLAWANNHPQGYSLQFTKNKQNLSKLPSELVSDYKNGWLSISANTQLTNGQHEIVN